MSKKSSKRVRKAVEETAAADGSAAVARHLRRPGFVAAALAASVLLAASFAATRFEPVRRAIGMQPLSAAVAQATPTPLPLSKEYIYAGGRLVATEEPTPSPSPPPTGPPPTALVATGYFPSQSTAAVKLWWSAPSSGSPTAYVIERASSRGQNGLIYSTVGSPVTTLPTQANPYIDQTAASGTVYVYHVKAVYAGGYSDFSNQDVANTVRYSGDDPLIGANDPQQRPASVVRAADLTELRAVIESVCALAGVGTGTWKNDPAPASQGLILKDHFAELRTNLNPALAALQISAVGDDSSLDTSLPVKAAHLQDVRDKVR